MVQQYPPNERYFNRDLSWLEFNRRVLFQAIDERTPLLERVRFLSIFSSNLDEFFMKRAGYLKRLIARGVTKTGLDESTPVRALAEVRANVLEMSRDRAEIYKTRILPRLREAGIHLLAREELSPEEWERATEYFKAKIFPVLTPLAVDPAHPFPFLSNLSVSLGVKLHQPKNRESLFARIKIPNTLPQWVQLRPDATSAPFRMVRLMDLISWNLSELFPEMVIENVTPFRVTRSADISYLRDGDEDVLDVVEEELRRRRLAEIVRVEHGENPDPWMMELIEDELKLGREDFFVVDGELDYTTLSELTSLPIADLKYRPWIPATPPVLSDESVDIFKAIREKDLLLHHPFDSFAGSVERLVRTAVDDPNVLAIKIALYRMGDDPQLVPLLIQAAEAGIQVVCVVEVTARFDEARNIYWSEMLEKAGVHVVYGVVGLKTHAKILLIVRREADDYRLYSHVGTGNYNAETSKQYTDLGLFTCDPRITSEMIEIFNYLTGLSLKRNYRKFLVSPINMRQRFMEMIEKEIENAREGKPAGIVAKMNSMEDQEICEALYRASGAGVPIDLIVRGFCCLRPGVEGLSQTIRVRSIVGRFLEHSRIYYFRSGAKHEADGKMFIGSADWMYRNLNNRVEAIVPIEDKDVRKQLWETLSMMLADRLQSWELRPDGKYELRSRVELEGEVPLHQKLMNIAKERPR